MTTVDTSDRLNQAIDFVLATAQQSKDFAVDQAPLVAQEIVNWYFWSSAIWLMICAGAIFVLYSLLWSMWYVIRREAVIKNGKPLSAQDEDVCYCVTFVTLLGSLFLWCGVVYNTLSITKACVAPRVVLIGELKGMVR